MSEIAHKYLVLSGKCITFCRQVGLPILGIIENMSGFVCPHCGKRSDIFAGHSGTQMADDFQVPSRRCGMCSRLCSTRAANRPTNNHLRRRSIAL